MIQLPSRKFDLLIDPGLFHPVPARVTPDWSVRPGELMQYAPAGRNTVLPDVVGTPAAAVAAAMALVTAAVSSVLPLPLAP
jgi:hypothetical protein